VNDFLKQDESTLRAQEGVVAHEEWKTQRAAVRAVASKPLWNVRIASSAEESLSAINESGSELVSEVLVERIPSTSRDLMANASEHWCTRFFL
jgi:hypothetical protein